jgi:hypothetical protein
MHKLAAATLRLFKTQKTDQLEGQKRVFEMNSFSVDEFGQIFAYSLMGRSIGCSETVVTWRMEKLRSNFWILKSNFPKYNLSFLHMKLSSRELFVHLYNLQASLRLI